MGKECSLLLVNAPFSGSGFQVLLDHAILCGDGVRFRNGVQLVSPSVESARMFRRSNFKILLNKCPGACEETQAQAYSSDNIIRSGSLIESKPRGEKLICSANIFPIPALLSCKASPLSDWRNGAVAEVGNRDPRAAGSPATGNSLCTANIVPGEQLRFDPLLGGAEVTLSCFVYFLFVWWCLVFSPDTIRRAFFLTLKGQPLVPASGGRKQE